MNGAEISIWGILIIIGAVQGYILSAVLFMRGPRNRMVALLILVVALHLSEYAVAITGATLQFPHLTAVTYPLLFLIGPLYYLYCRDLAAGVPYRWRDVLHALPALGVLLAFLPFYLQSADEKRTFIMGLAPEGTVEVPAGQFIFMALQGVQTLIYLVLASRLVKQGRQRLKQLSAGLEVGTMRWLIKATRVLIGYFLLFFISIVILLMVDSHRIEIDYVIVLLLAALIYAMAYNVLRHPDIFSGTVAVRDQVRAQMLLSNTEQVSVAESLRAYVAREKPYLSESLRLSDVAGHLEIPPHQLSEVLNVEIGSNFFDFINGYRVEEAKQLLADPALGDRKILAVAFDSGFGNKATFNRAFKKHTGMTPSAYRTAHRTRPQITYDK